MQELKLLEEQRRFLFHGSPIPDIQTLEPRQPYSGGTEDGKPCVAVTEVVELAAFMAVFKARATHYFGWDIKYQTPRNPAGFFANPKDYLRARQQDWLGYVYVFDRDYDLFDQYFWRKKNITTREWRAYTKVSPQMARPVRCSEITTSITLVSTPCR